ncbi:Uma2 family endonuclease [Pseudogracilibacillus sp. SO30301A]|uniref:Uma2 family endonuclease n=1 Tax=Pseudogracilibacillus sp. SO30301A TaxID=3098291 RepID=UPI00300E1B95
MSLPKEEREYTYVDYLSWPKDERIEIINGTPYLQAAPSRIHQEILSEIHRQIANYLIDKNCKVYPAPFAVILDLEEEEEEDIKNVVEPDITIVCDEEKLDDRGCKGSPDMVVEIISPSTARKDKIEKFNLYEKTGVQEYWIVEPEEKILSVFTLQANQRYGRPGLYSEDDNVPVSIFEDLQINLNIVFSQ